MVVWKRWILNWPARNRKIRRSGVFTFFRDRNWLTARLMNIRQFLLCNYKQHKILCTKNNSIKCNNVRRHCWNIKNYKMCTMFVEYEFECVWGLVCGRKLGRQKIEVVRNVDHWHVKIVDLRSRFELAQSNFLELPLPVHFLDRVQRLRLVVVPQEHRFLFREEY